MTEKEIDRKIRKLPKGLQEFAGSLLDTEYAGGLLPRLLDLPENGFHMTIENHKAALKAVAEAEKALAAARRAASSIAFGAFLQAVDNWTVKELQEATGYDHE
jgi:hypothetical protein